jgi:S1-C subfamily serine protease
MTEQHTPEPSTSNPPAPVKKGVKPHPSRPRPLSIIAIGLFCFVLSFLGAWAALAAGVVKSDSTTITEKRNIVSQEGDVLADVAKRVSPSVVSILTESQASVGFRSFTQQSAGTGIIISDSGYVLTNKHVVDGANKVEIVLADGTNYQDVEVVGTDPVNDLAFLKIKDGKNLKAAVIGDSSEMKVGEKVIAIGNALGQYQTTVTSGIISGLGRPLVAGDQASGQTEQLRNLLQTDAAINPGNSGGPLVNLSGEVIGINTAIDKQAEGIGFAIPINDAKGLIQSVTKTGKLSRAFLGVSYISVTSDVIKQYDLSVDHGAYVMNQNGDAVTPDSPADKAGLKAGDVITKVDNAAINATNPLLSAVSTHVPGDNVSLTYVRDGKPHTVTVTLASYPNS